MAAERVRVGILGASGYTGAELLRLLGDHPRAQIRTLTAERQAGKPVAEVWPQLGPYKLPDLVKIGELDAHGLDVVFCCLPHGTTQAVIRDLPRGPRIIDLSADFRLRDLAHLCRRLRPRASGIRPSRRRPSTGSASTTARPSGRTRLVANPGCFTTTAELPLIPLLRRRLIRQEGIIIDAKSGVSGAGRETRLSSLFTEVAEGIHAYGVATHRHTPEIEQCLADFAGAPIRVTFTPHLVPMSRGLLATIYVRMADAIDVQTLHAALAEAYAGEPFVHVLPFKTMPATRHTRGSNLCMIGVHPSRIAGEAILVAALDNLVKGASGQAVQNMNIQLGLDETMGLGQRPLFP